MSSDISDSKYRPPNPERGDKNTKTSDDMERRVPESRSFDQTEPPDRLALSRAGLKASITARQLECLYWVLQGKSANDIGGILGISGRTVEEHLLKACSRFGVKSRHQAAWQARELGLLPPLDP